MLIIALQAGQSSQGTFEPITPVLDIVVNVHINDDQPYTKYVGIHIISNIAGCVFNIAQLNSGLNLISLKASLADK